MENSTLEKVLDMAGSAAKVAANLSEKKDIPAMPVRPMNSDDSNNATTGSQSVIVSVDKGKKKDPKPVEKHIHEFPEQRALTEQECELALKKAQMDYELEKSKQEHLIRMDRVEWEHRLETEKKNERKGLVRRIIGGILVAIGGGAVVYSCYADYRDHKNAPVAQKAIQAPVKAEGEVK